MGSSGLATLKALLFTRGRVSIMPPATPRKGLAWYDFSHCPQIASRHCLQLVELNILASSSMALAFCISAGASGGTAGRTGARAMHSLYHLSSLSYGMEETRL